MTQPLAQIVDLGFSVADGEKVRVSYENQTLSVSFVDWQEKPISFICRDTIAFRWQEAEYSLSDGERYDSTHEIIGSPWLRQHQEQGMTWEATAFHHYKLNFNAAGILEMICSRIDTIAESGRREDCPSRLPHHRTCGSAYGGSWQSLMDAAATLSLPR